MALFSLFDKKCAICKRKSKPLRKYVDDQGKQIKVCIPCSEYAERRAFQIRK